MRVQESMRASGLSRCGGHHRSEASTTRRRPSSSFSSWKPGPHYTFGKLTVNGLGLDGEAAIRKDVERETGRSRFRRAIRITFSARSKRKGFFDNLGDTKASPDVNLTMHRVDVTLDFKFARDQPKKPLGPGGFPGQIP